MQWRWCLRGTGPDEPWTVVGKVAGADQGERVEAASDPADTLQTQQVLNLTIKSIKIPANNKCQRNIVTQASPFPERKIMNIGRVRLLYSSYVIPGTVLFQKPN